MDTYAYLPPRAARLPRQPRPRPGMGVATWTLPGWACVGVPGANVARPGCKFKIDPKVQNQTNRGLPWAERADSLDQAY